MPTDITELSDGKSYGVTYTRKVSDGNYGSVEMSTWVSVDGTGKSQEELYVELATAGNTAKAVVFDHLGIKAELNGEDVLIEKAVEAVVRAFPGTTVERSGQVEPGENFAPVTNMPVRIKGKPEAIIPDWLIKECAEAGVTEVYDNRDNEDPAKRNPMFRATTKAPGEKYAKGFGWKAK